MPGRLGDAVTHLVRLLPLLALLLVPWTATAAGDELPETLVEADLVADVPASGEAWLGVRLRHAEHWHTYWRNPGDSGLPTRIEWELPAGYVASDIVWPTPELYRVGPVMNFGYGDETVLLAKVQVPDGVQAGATLPVKANVSWLVCSADTCIPGRTTLAADVQVGKADPAIAQARKRVPAPSPWPVELESGADALALRIPALAGAQVKSAYFFPQDGETLDHPAEQKLTIAEDGLRLALKPSALASGPIGKLEGILVLEEDLGGSVAKQAFAVSTGKAPAAAAAPVAAADEPANPAAALGLFEVLGLAILGGVILNLMPCVFPVLSLKVLGVAQQASEAPGRIRMHGVAYTGGILASFAALAGALIALRAGGAQIGWGFQLQSPAFVAILTYVLFAMALSLSGVVHFGNSIVGIGSSLASRPGLSGSFFTGVLATVVATPCTAPFMGAAIGYAIIQPAFVALSIFLALGLGLALPFLVLSFVPAMHRLLPRPGAWMETLKQALAFPLYGTVAWLVWVLQLQVGPDGLAATLAGLVLVALAAWAWGASRIAGTTMRRVGAGVTAVATGVALFLVQVPATREVSAAPTAAAAAKHYEPWTPQRLDELRGEGKPVFVNFTAAWCVTCLVNERTAMATPATQALFAEKGVTYLKGDWTNRDPAITKALEKFGRSGVPLYLLYDGKSAEPVVLPQILTEETMREHLDAI
jgi:thiol:disulfide interchange protein/DsbC/DsbD-like thiol-disulfide interchange protein